MNSNNTNSMNSTMAVIPRAQIAGEKKSSIPIVNHHMKTINTRSRDKQDKSVMRSEHRHSSPDMTTKNTNDIQSRAGKTCDSNIVDQATETRTDKTCDGNKPDRLEGEVIPPVCDGSECDTASTDGLDDNRVLCVCVLSLLRARAHASSWATVVLLHSFFCCVRSLHSHSRSAANIRRPSEQIPMTAKELEPFFLFIFSFYIRERRARAWLGLALQRRRCRSGSGRRSSKRNQVCLSPSRLACRVVAQGWVTVFLSVLCCVCVCRIS